MCLPIPQLLSLEIGKVCLLLLSLARNIHTTMHHQLPSKHDKIANEKLNLVFQKLC